MYGSPSPAEWCVANDRRSLEVISAMCLRLSLAMLDAEMRSGFMISLRALLQDGLAWYLPATPVCHSSAEPLYRHNRVHTLSLDTLYHPLQLRRYRGDSLT